MFTPPKSELDEAEYGSQEVQEPGWSYKETLKKHFILALVLRTIGGVYVLFAVAQIFLLFSEMFRYGTEVLRWFTSVWISPDMRTSIFLSVLLQSGVIGAYALVGYGLFKLQCWARIPGALLAMPFILLFPIGTFLGIAATLVIAHAAGTEIYKLEYQEALYARRKEGNRLL